MISIDLPYASAAPLSRPSVVSSYSNSWVVSDSVAAPQPAAICSQSNSGGSIPGLINVTEWSAILQNRFNKLVRLKALDKITEVELGELVYLQKKRRELMNPQSVDDIYSERDRNRAEDNLIAALKAYVRIKPSNC